MSRLMKFLFCFFAIDLVYSKGKVCKSSLIQSYGMQSYVISKPMEFYLCPKITLSCCSLFDQLTMYNRWHDEIKPKLTSYYDSLAFKMDTLKDNIEEFFLLDI